MFADMLDMLKKGVNFFLSRRVAIILLTLMILQLMLSTQLPDLKSMNAEDINFYREERPFAYRFSSILGGEGITSSYFFLILPTFIFMSTLFCTINRLVKTKKKGMSFWGSILFHAGLLIIIVASVVTMMTLFEGEFLLTEGYTYSLGRDGYLKVSREPMTGIELPKGTITMTRYRNIYHGEVPIDHEATVMLEREGNREIRFIKVNEPLQIDDIHYTLNRYGFAPAFVIRDDKNTLLLDAFVNLEVVAGKEDSFEIPGKNIRIVVRFFPDFEMTKDGPVNKSRLPNNPVAAVKVVNGDIETKFRHVGIGNEVEMMGLKITFPELKYWAHVLVNRDRGEPLFFLGFILAVGGLIVRFLTMGSRKINYENS